MDHSSIGSAAIGGAFVLIAAILPGWLASRRATNRALEAARTAAIVRETLGTKNGNGTVVEMSEKVLGVVTESLGWQQNHERSDNIRFGGVEDRFGGLEASVGKIREHLGIPPD